MTSLPPTSPSLPPSLPKAYIYTRRSTITQDTTHESQERDCRAWAKHNGYQVAGVSYDDCSGSTPVDQREGFIHIVTQIKHDEVLLIKCRDRLGRDVSVNTVAAYSSDKIPSSCKRTRRDVCVYRHDNIFSQNHVLNVHTLSRLQTLCGQN